MSTAPTSRTASLLHILISALILRLATFLSAAHRRIGRRTSLVHRPVPLISSSLHSVAEDAGGRLGGRQPLAYLVPAVVVDVEDVKGVERPGEEAEDR